MNHIVYKLPFYEYHKYRTHLLSLDASSRYSRFGYSITDYQIEQFCNKVESAPQDHTLFVIEDEALTVIAVGHIAINPNDIELAFSVLPAYHRKGMAHALMGKCLEWCTNRGIKKGNMVCLTSNTPIKKLAAKYCVLVAEGTETTATIHIPTPTPVSYFSEIVTDSIASFDHYRKIQRNIIGLSTK